MSLRWRADGTVNWCRMIDCIDQPIILFHSAEPQEPVPFGWLLG